jgi:hypothetical protein
MKAEEVGWMKEIWKTRDRMEKERGGDRQKCYLNFE